MRLKRLGVLLSEAALCSMLLSAVPTGIIYADEVQEAQATEETAAGEEETEVAELEKVKISNVDALIKLAQESTAEEYTRNREFILTADLDLSGKEFKPIAMMAGNLNGNGHTIKGFVIDEAASESGFIRSVAKTGVVMDLRVEGRLTPKGSMKNIGGIAGINYGTIENCVFAGSILAEEAVGGIAGRNMPSANIIMCTNEAEVLATRRTGGIAGYNEGIIAGCINKGEVNADKKSASERIDLLKDEKKKTVSGDGEETEEDDSDDDETDQLSKLNPDNIDLKDDDLLERFENEHKVNYTGGIAGVSKGTLVGNTNQARVGYAHLGYNTGGIVGYERGILYGCENSGRVNGRKNIGGIAGEFEPYVQNIYSDDSIDKAQGEMGGLVDMTEELNNKIGVEDDKTQLNIDAVRYSMDDLRDRIKEWKEYYRCKDDGVERDLRGRIDEIRARVNDLDMDIKSGKAEKAMDSIQGDLDKMYGLLEQQRQAAQYIDLQTGQTISSGSTASAVQKGVAYLERDIFNNTMGIEQMKNLNPIVQDMINQSDTLIDYVEHEIDDADDLKEDLEDIRELGNGLDDFLRGVYDDYKNEIRKTDDDLTARVDAIDILMDNLADGLKVSDKIIRDQLDKMVAQMQSVNDTIDEGFDEVDAEFARLRDTDDINEIFTDVSDDEDETPGLGKIVSCNNLGTVISDINGGGIVGSVDVDTSLTSDFEVVSGGNVSLNYDRIQKATVIRCVNNGQISVKSDYAGGIAGRADVGAIIRCENYGGLLTDEGDYTGGIVGKSGYLVKNSYSMAMVEGNTYVGGIAGEAFDISGNYAMVTIKDKKGEKYGSIAGYLNEDGTASGNYFVSDTAAINGLTFADEAKEITYHMLTSLPDTPKDFKQIRVIFMVDDEILEERRVNYGASIPYEDFPKLPEDMERFGVWERQDLTNIRQNTVVNADYISKTSTIASAEPFPVLLLVGDFYSGTSLSYHKSAAPLDILLDGYELLDEFNFTISGEYGTITDEYEARLLADEYKDIDSVAVNDGSVIRPVETSRDGRYMVFNIHEGESFYIIRSKAGQIKRYIWIGAGCVAGLLVLGFIISRILYAVNRKKRKNGKPEKASDSKEGEKKK